MMSMSELLMMIVDIVTLYIEGSNYCCITKLIRKSETIKPM